ncbi:MAG: OsmC family protein [Rikenellaceae bacterium]
MATISTTYLGDLRTEITHVQSGNKVTTDAPTDNQGKGEFISPTDMLSASLGSCMLTIMGISAKAHGFTIDGTKLEITKIMATEPRRVSEIDVKIILPKISYTNSQKRMIEAAAKSCPVAHSLHPDIKQVFSYVYFDN